MVISECEYPAEGRASLVAGLLTANDGITTSSIRIVNEQLHAVAERCCPRSIIRSRERECGKSCFLTALFQHRILASS